MRILNKKDTGNKNRKDTVKMKNGKELLSQPLIDVGSDETVQHLVNMEYKKYLQTKYWKAVRQKMFDLLGYKCEICGLEKFIAIHHFNYCSLGRETLNDLACLCEDCHEKIHYSENALTDFISNRKDFEKRVKKAKKIKKGFDNKKFLKILPLTIYSSWKLEMLESLYDCSKSEIEEMFKEEIKERLIEKSLAVCGDNKMEFYTLDRFAWIIIRLDFPVTEKSQII